MECLWVEFTPEGRTNTCQWAERMEFIDKHYTSLPEFKRMEMFANAICKSCMEGMKIQAMYDKTNQ